MKRQSTRLPSGQRWGMWHFADYTYTQKEARAMLPDVRRRLQQRYYSTEKRPLALQLRIKSIPRKMVYKWEIHYRISYPK